MRMEFTPIILAQLIAAVPPSPPPDWDRRHLLRSPDLHRLLNGQLTMEEALNSPTLDAALAALAEVRVPTDSDGEQLAKPFDRVPPTPAPDAPLGW